MERPRSRSIQNNFGPSKISSIILVLFHLQDQRENWGKRTRASRPAEEKPEQLRQRIAGPFQGIAILHRRINGLRWYYRSLRIPWRWWHTIAGLHFLQARPRWRETVNWIAHVIFLGQQPTTSAGEEEKKIYTYINITFNIHHFPEFFSRVTIFFVSFSRNY